MWYVGKDVSPMLIGKEAPPFDDKNYLYEIKMDGIRCLAYIEKDQVDFINKRDMQLAAKFPELRNIYKQVKHSCVLDGELHIFENGRSNFFQVQKRALRNDPFKIRMHASSFPASFTVFDILYAKNQWLLDVPLLKRKEMLQNMIEENERIQVSRYVEEKGTALFQLTKEHQLEGIVAKRKDSLYYMGKRTKDWIKCKHLLEDDFIITGYIPKKGNLVSLVLAQYYQDHLIYKGHVTMGVSLPYVHSHSQPSDHCPYTTLPKGNEEAIWIQPHLVGIVSFMEYTASKGLRQPIFKGFRNDKEPRDCIEPNEI